MEEEVLTEISNYCSKECNSHYNCVEEDCILYRIEKLILEGGEYNEDSDNEIQGECEITI